MCVNARVPGCLHSSDCRHHPSIKLSGVPDLMVWGSDGPTACMGAELEKATSPQEAVALVASFVTQQQ